MDKEYYRKFYLGVEDRNLENFYYSSPSISWFNYQRKKVILRYFKKLEKGRKLNILDVGVGKGKILFEIQKKSVKAHNYYGIDVDELILDYPRSFTKRNSLKNFHFLNLDISKKGWSKKINKKFDLIILSEVIEHLFPEDQQIVLKEIEKILSPNGLFIITCPNKSCQIKKIIRILQKVPGIKNSLSKLGKFKGSKGHVAEPSFFGLERSASDFEIVKHGGFTFSYGNEIIDNNSFYFIMLLFLNSFFKFFLPFFCFDQYIVLKIKKIYKYRTCLDGRVSEKLIKSKFYQKILKKILPCESIMIICSK
jgi:SAM-dependent methyltransferase